MPQNTPSGSGAAEEFLARGIDCHDRGDLEKAVAAYTEAIRADPGLVMAYNNLGMVYLDMEDLAAAERQFTKAIELNPGLAEAHNNMGYVLRRQERDAEAAKHYEQFLQLEPSAEDAKKIRDWIAKVKARSPAEGAAAPKTDSSAAGSAAKTPSGSEVAGEREKELALVILPVEEEADADAIADEGHAAFEAGDLAKAEELFRRALAVNPELTSALAGLGNILARLKRPEEAIPVLSKAIALDPADAANHYALGQALRAQGRDVEAVASFEEFLRLMPEAEEKDKIVAWIAETRAAAEKPAAAPAPEKSVQTPAPAPSAPSPADACLERAQELMDDNHLDQALAACEEGLAQDEGHYGCNLLLGRILIRKEDYLRAVPVLRRATEVAPGSAEAWFYLGTAFEKRGLVKEARSAYESCLAAGPSGPQADRVRELLAGLQGGKTEEMVRCEYCFNAAPASQTGMYKNKPICAACASTYGISIATGEKTSAGGAALAHGLDDRPAATRESLRKRPRLKSRGLLATSLKVAALALILLGAGGALLYYLQPDVARKLLPWGPSEPSGLSSPGPGGAAGPEAFAAFQIKMDAPLPARALLLRRYERKMSVTGGPPGAAEKAVFSVSGPGATIDPKTGALIFFPGQTREGAFSAPNLGVDETYDLTVSANVGGASVPPVSFHGTISFGFDPPRMALSGGSLSPGQIWTAGNFFGGARRDLVTVRGRFDEPGLWVMRQTPEGSFQAPVRTALPGAPSAAAVGDWNGDGKEDLALADWTHGQILIYYGGDDFPGSPQVLTVGKGPISLLAADFTRDGKPDLVVTHSIDENVLVFHSNPSRPAGPGPALDPGRSRTLLLSAPDPWAVPLAIDMGDPSAAKPALAISTGGTPESDFRVFGCEGTELNPKPVQSRWMEDRPFALATGDFTGTHVRMVAAMMGGNTQKAQVRVLACDADGRFHEVPGFEILLADMGGETPYSIAVADFNADGRDDIALGFASGVRVWLSTGKGFLKPLRVPVKDSAVLGLMARDMDGNGFPDLIVPLTDGSAAVLAIKSELAAAPPSAKKGK